MEPLHETRLVINALIKSEGTDLGDIFTELAQWIEAVVPDIVGLSIGLVDDDLVFTFVASSVAVAAIDAAQYLDGGPCVEASTRGRIETWAWPADATGRLDEQQWALYARVTAAQGVASSLSLPLIVNGRPVGGVNLYASTPDGFDGHHEELARAVGARLDDVVMNADLSFRTRSQAAEAPARLADRDHIEMAVGMLAQRHQIDASAARQRLAASALRAGISEAQAARALVNAQNA